MNAAERRVRARARQARNTMIYFRKLAGHTYARVGRDYGISNQRVHQIVAGRRKESPPVERLATDLLRKATVLSETGWEPAVARASELRQAAFVLATLTEKPDRHGLRGMNRRAALAAVEADAAPNKGGTDETE